MPEDVQRIIKAVKEAARMAEENTAYLDDREDRVIWNAISKAFESLAHSIEVEFQGFAEQD